MADGKWLGKDIVPLKLKKMMDQDLPPMTLFLVTPRGHENKRCACRFALILFSQSG